MGVVTAELLGAALFAFEPAVIAGFALLMGSLVAAAALHMHMSRIPWHLAFYALAAALLLYFTRRARRATRAH
jgi:membrane protein implicated in regulation of membrane protease activity